MFSIDTFDMTLPFCFKFIFKSTSIIEFVKEFIITVTISVRIINFTYIYPKKTNCCLTDMSSAG
jgi:hypothetical protein